MRHRKKGLTLDRAKGPRAALQRSLLRNLVVHRSLRTTTARAATVIPLVQRLLVRAKDQSLSSRRYLLSVTGDARVVQQLFSLAKDAPVHPIESFRLGRRVGDGAQTILIRVKLAHHGNETK